MYKTVIRYEDIHSDEFLEIDNVETVKIFSDKILACIRRNTVVIRKTTDAATKPWITKEVIELSRKKNWLYSLEKRLLRIRTFNESIENAVII